jgi:hypothetical protein
MDEAMGKGMPQQLPENVQQVLTSIPYPTTKQDLVRIAQQNHAPDPLVQKIRSLPGDQFASPQDVIKAFQQTR